MQGGLVIATPLLPKLPPKQGGLVIPRISQGKQTTAQTGGNILLAGDVVEFISLPGVLLQIK